MDLPLNIITIPRKIKSEYSTEFNPLKRYKNILKLRKFLQITQL